ncbi:aminomethyltransferase family protein [uncultured Nitrospira sp.]|uniref:CAF17-like 4Fe-4S cluster assembly/insertion protein YgfZ n=1 Tax=uncultured Nitrospira sp. TaxID=157176 RepID=UPI003140BFC7
MKTLALHKQHETLGATFQPCGEWEVPLHYGNPLLEYESIHQKAGLADLSLRGKIMVTGDDRVSWLQSIISNDILPLKPGQGRYSAFMNHKGKMLSYFRVFLQPETLIIEDVGEVGDLTFQALRKFLLYGTKAKLHNGLESWGLLLVTGPNGPDILKQALGVEVNSLQVLDTIAFTFGDIQGVIARTEETGGQDFELFVQVEGLPALWSHLLTIGKEAGLQPIGREALETARIEGGLSRLGPDLNEKIVPPEANLEGIAFSLSKGCYPGQEVVARMDTYGSVKRRMVGLVLEVEPPQLPEAGAKLFSGTREVGWVSSSTHSPLIKKPIALGFPLRDFTQPQTKLEIEIRDQRFPASVCALPFTPI